MINIFEVISSITADNDKVDGALKRVKRKLLINGLSFTEVEAVTTKWLQENTNYPENMDIPSIKKANHYQNIHLNELIEYDHEVVDKLVEYIPNSENLYFWEMIVAVDEIKDDGSVKVVKEKHLLVGEDLQDATVRLEEKLIGLTMDWSIAGGKATDIWAILVDEDSHKVKCLDANLPVEYGK